jgi:hypothetical protein
VSDENSAAELANDHAFPGWRELPVVPSPPHDDNPKKKAQAEAKWQALVDRMLPAGWLKQGGPIRTLRGVHGTRHVPGRAPGGGYDMSAGVDPAAQRAYDAAADRREQDAAAAASVEEVVDGRPVETVQVGDQYALDFGI